MRCRAVVAPLMRQRDSELARIALDQLDVGLRRGPIRHELARRAAAAMIDERRSVAHAARLTALDRDEAAEIRQMRRDREHAARDLQPDVAVDAGGDADRAAAVGGM